MTASDHEEAYTQVLENLRPTFADAPQLLEVRFEVVKPPRGGGGTGCWGACRTAEEGARRDLRDRLARRPHVNGERGAMKAFPAYRRIATLIFLRSRRGGPVVEEVANIDPLELQAAQERDAGPQTLAGYHSGYLGQNNGLMN